METKKCPSCEKTKDIEAFRRLTGLKNKFNKMCADCIAPIKFRAKQNKEKLKIYQKSYRDKDENKAYQKEYRKKWVPENKELVNSLGRETYNGNEIHRNKQLTRTRLRGLVAKAFEFEMELGCTFEQFKAHMESQFKPGMTWENYGRGIGFWSIDHIKPLSKDDSVNPNHYTNLQPLWYEENSVKHNK